jgi:hypothetical protein
VAFETFPCSAKPNFVYYFEVYVIDGGKESQFGIGFGDTTTPDDTIPGTT